MAWNWRKGAGQALTVAGLAALVAACGGAANGGNGASTGALGPQNSLIKCPSSPNTTAASAETGTINLTVAGFSSTPAEDALVQKGLNDFTAAHPNIHITWTPIPGDYPTKMRANIASGSVPDVFYVTPQMGAEYTPAGKLLNLSPYMQRDNVAPGDYYTPLQQTFDCANGTVYGIPKDWNSLGLFYNKTMFQAAGVGDPTNWSWTDLQSAAQKLTGNGVTGISLSADASRWGAFLSAAGGQMLSSDGKTAAFTSQAAQDSATFYTSFEKNKTGVMPSDVGAGWNGEAFGKGEVAMTLEGGWMIPYLASTFPNIQYGIAPMPKDPTTGKSGDLVYTNAWGAYSGSAHPEAAWEVIKYMTGATYQKQVLDDGFALPSIKSLANDPYFTQNPGFAVLAQGAQNGVADFYGVADTEVHTDVGNALQSVMLGKSNVKDALDAASQKVNTWIQQNG